MTQTIVLDGLDELPKITEGLRADIERIDYASLLGDELTRMALQHKQYFDSQAGPDGQPWAANAPSTIGQKGHTLILRGKLGTRPLNVKATRRRPAVGFSRARGIARFRLATSLTAQTTQTFGDAIREAIQESPAVAYLMFGTSVEYSVYNQFGTSRIPPRPHVGISSDYLQKMTERAADFTMQRLKT